MNDAQLVRRRKRLAHLTCKGQRIVERNRPARDPLRQIVTLDEFHDEGVDITAVFKSVNDGDVRVIQRRQSSGFTVEAGNAFRIRRERLWQHLDRDFAIQS